MAPRSLDALMAQGQALQRAGQGARAEQVFRDVLRRSPGHADALHSLGLIALQAGALPAAAELIGQAAAAAGADADIAANLGHVLMLLARPADALASLDRALALAPGHLAALNNRGNALCALGRHDESVSAFDEALAQRADYLEARYNRGNALHAAGRLEQALDDFERVIAVRPDIAQAHNNRARVLQDLGRQALALQGYDQALRLAPRTPAFLLGRASARLALAEPAQALADADAALRLAPANPQAHYARGNALLALRRADDAILAFTRCLELDAGHLDARINRANASYEVRRYEDAIADCDAVLARSPALAGVVCNRGNAWLELKGYDRAAADFQRVLELDPAYPYALGKRLHAQAMACDWRDLPALVAAVDDGLAAGRAVIEPFAYAGVATSPAAMRRCAELFIADQFPPQPARVAAAHRHGHARIRIGYLGGEFRNQATSILATEFWELHDRERFEIVAFDNGWNDGSTLRRRIDAAFDEVVDIARLPDDAAAQAIAGREIDILVNLNGFFGLGRTGVFARRPAPVQVNWLGFPGTLGASYIDVIVADATTIPPGEEGAYAERVLRLPGSYQPNDRQRRIAGAAPDRAALGLPEDGVVFACFNNTYKIGPEVFAAWMRILAGTPGSVLWLLEDNPPASANLRQAAAGHGVDPARLRFAPRIRLDEHLARHCRADLFLDTWPYNAHTTASDALWAGLPVLSCRGTTFAGRVGASLLGALGLADTLLVESAEDFVARAVALAHDPAQLGAIRERLEAARATAALFDTPAYCRAMEALFIELSS